MISIKKVIDGKLYNSETATLIARWDNGQFPSDFRHCSENLCMTKKGAFFIHGSGGAMSKYAVQCGGNSMGGSSDLIALSPEAAKNWICGHLTNKELEQALKAAGFNIQAA